MQPLSPASSQRVLPSDSTLTPSNQGVLGDSQQPQTRSSFCERDVGPIDIETVLQVPLDDFLPTMRASEMGGTSLYPRSVRELSSISEQGADISTDEMNQRLEKTLAAYPNFNWTFCDSEASIADYLKYLKQQPERFECAKLPGHAVIEDPASKHCVAVRMHIGTGQVQCFINDSQGTLSTSSSKTRGCILEQIKKVFSHSSIVVGTFFEKDSDIRGCHFLVVDAMRAFASKGDGFDQLLEAVPAPGADKLAVGTFPRSHLPKPISWMAGSSSPEWSQQEAAATEERVFEALATSVVMRKKRDIGIQTVSKKDVAVQTMPVAVMADQERVVTKVDTSEAPTTSEAVATGEKRAFPEPGVVNRAGLKRGRFSAKMSAAEFLYKLASDPDDDSVVWLESEPGVCVFKNPDKAVERWHTETGGTKVYRFFSRTLRCYYGEEILKPDSYRSRLQYAFRLDHSNVIKWKNEVEEQRVKEQSEPVSDDSE